MLMSLKYYFVNFEYSAPVLARDQDLYLYKHVVFLCSCVPVLVWAWHTDAWFACFDTRFVEPVSLTESLRKDGIKSYALHNKLLETALHMTHGDEVDIEVSSRSCAYGYRGLVCLFWSKLSTIVTPMWVVSCCCSSDDLISQAQGTWSPVRAALMRLLCSQLCRCRCRESCCIQLASRNIRPIRLERAVNIPALMGRL